MRLHQLSLTAFGPFAGTVAVDFDTLSSAGLFLLTGPMGAGKSSVLDGICFALFGRVAGERDHAGQLRSQHAAPDVAPVVQLELTLSGRRLRVTRSPAWQRPKRRAAGSTPERARVLLEEFGDAGWTGLTTRADEAGHVLGGLLGMNLDQFLQVALLPQGEFQRFLTATASDRQALLEKLFRTRVYQLVEVELGERRRSASAADRDLHQRASAALSRLVEAGGHALPDDFAPEALGAAADSGRLTDWIHGTVDALAGQSERSSAALAAAEVAASDAEERLGVARERAAARTRGMAAQARLAALAEAEPARTAERERLDAARRAAPVRPLRLVAEESQAQQRAAEAAWELALAALGAEFHDVLTTADDASVSPDALAEAERRAHEAEVTARRFIDHEAELRRHRQTRAAAEQAVATLKAEQADLLAEQAGLPAEVAAAAEEVARAEGIAVTLAGAEAAVGEAQERLAAVLAIEETRARLADQARVLAESRATALDARARLLEVRERRIAGMAAELAVTLAVGDGCPVCGSHEHPRPAAPAADHVDDASERAAQRAADDQGVALQVAEEEHRTLARQLDELASVAAGADEAQVQHDLAQARAAVESAQAAARSLPALRAAAKDRSIRAETLQQRLQQLATESGRSQADLAHATAAERDCESSLRDLLGSAESAVDSVAELVAGHARRRRLLAAARSAATALESTRAQREIARTRATRSAEMAGFDSAEAAGRAALEPEQIAQLSDELAAQDAEAVRAQAILDEPEVVAALTTEADDLAALERTSATCTAAARTATAAATRDGERLQRCIELAAELDEVVAQWAPVRERLALISALAAVAEGRGDDNEAKISLSAYVLAERLRQVVDAANERLGPMCDQRYRLQHSEAKAGRERRAGLGLLVLDDWNGSLRSPATLSGGETFVVSLALALGLADVVSREAGGAELGTLFVDEGFGSLDSETLEDVLDTLDTLRDGGRVVGVVSHVAEMRDRIPTQLVVRKQRGGSTLAEVGP